MIKHYAAGHPAPFVGRASELSDITARLGEPDCRLLTLIGLGGSGKTRLAIEAARAVADQFTHGAVFVGLQPLDGAALIATILADAPGVKILATSREALSLREEWLYPLKGLATPPSAPTDSLEAYAAVQLFLAHARRIQPGFDTAQNREAVIRICQLTAGLPLAIELAAA